MGRGELVFVRQRRGNSESAELDPEGTRSTDQTLTELALQGANSDCNATTLRDREKAADRVAHIQRGLSATQNGVLLKARDVAEARDSVRDIARKTDLHPMEVSRAFAAARKADKQEIFKRTSRQRRLYRPYNPRWVPMEIVMMPHQGPILYSINVPGRVASAEQHQAPHINGCCHPNQEWLRSGFDNLRLTCLDCKAELDRAGILSKP